MPRLSAHMVYKAQQYLVTYGGAASHTQPRQLGTTNILIHAPLYGLLRVLSRFQDGYYTQIISSAFLWCSSLFLKCNSYSFSEDLGKNILAVLTCTVIWLLITSRFSEIIAIERLSICL